MTSRQYRSQLRYPERTRARREVFKAVRLGTLPAPTSLACTDCHSKASEYDHWLGYDLDHQLDVQPVCKTCHEKRGKNLRSDNIQIVHQITAESGISFNVVRVAVKDYRATPAELIPFFIAHQLTPRPIYCASCLQPLPLYKTKYCSMPCLAAAKVLVARTRYQEDQDYRNARRDYSRNYGALHARGGKRPYKPRRLRRLD